MLYLYGIALVGLIVSAFANIKKTKKVLIIAWKQFVKLLPILSVTLIFVSIVLFFLPDNVIAKYLGAENAFLGVVLAIVIGSVSLLPGFVTFPLCGLLLNQGVSYTVLAAFSTSLMMVGIITFPLEKKYFGTKLALIRNLSSLIIALIVSLAVGIIYGEIV